MHNQLCCNENLYSTLLDLIESMGFWIFRWPVHGRSFDWSCTLLVIIPSWLPDRRRADVVLRRRADGVLTAVLTLHRRCSHAAWPPRSNFQQRVTGVQANFFRRTNMLWLARQLETVVPSIWDIWTHNWHVLAQFLEQAKFRTLQEKHFKREIDSCSWKIEIAVMRNSAKYPYSYNSQSAPECDLPWMYRIL